MKRVLFALILYCAAATPMTAGEWNNNPIGLRFAQEETLYPYPKKQFFDKLKVGCREEQNITRHMNCLVLVDRLGVLARKLAWDRSVYGQLMAYTRVLLTAFPRLRLLVFPSA